MTPRRRARGKGGRGKRRSPPAGPPGASGGALRREIAALRAEVRAMREQLRGLEGLLGGVAPGGAAAPAPRAPPRPEDFYRELRRAHERRATPLGTAAVPDLRELVCEALGIGASAFDDALVECWRRGLVSLEPGSPIGRPDAGHLEYRGKRYYYVRLAPTPAADPTG